MNLISIVLPSFNGEKYISQSIESIISQTYPNWELILVDDCSKDNTLNIMKRFEKKDERIKIISNKTNKNLPNSLNIGFKESRGSLLTWTSDDNIFHKNALYEMSKRLEKNDTFMVVADMCYIDSEGKVINPAQPYDEDLFWYNNNVGACFMYKREVYEKIGEYNSNSFGIEDYDYWIRVRKEYERIERINDILYKYRIHENSLSSKKFVEIKKLLNNLRKTNLDYILSKCINEEIRFAIYFDMMITEKDINVLNEKSLKVQNDFFKDYDERNRRIFIWGAGEYGKKAIKLFDNVIAFVDTNKNKIGQIFEGKKVISLEEYIEKYADGQLVVAVDAISLYSISKNYFELKGKKITTYHQVVNCRL